MIEAKKPNSLSKLKEQGEDYVDGQGAWAIL
jgi:hypothetical protein